MMKAPRRPRGEKPATTIRLLRQQLSIAQATVKALQMDRADKESVIAGYDAQLEEANQITKVLRIRCADQAVEIGAAQQRNRLQSERLAFLEGYYAKSQETAALPLEKVSFPRWNLPDNPAQIDPRGRQGNSPHNQAQSQGAAIPGAAPRSNGRSGEEIRGEPPRDQAYQAKRPVEHVKINWDALTTNADGSPIPGQGR